jgi:hypothetical protein
VLDFREMVSLSLSLSPHRHFGVVALGVEFFAPKTYRRHQSLEPNSFFVWVIWEQTKQTISKVDCPDKAIARLGRTKVGNYKHMHSYQRITKEKMKKGV